MENFNQTVIDEFRTTDGKLDSPRGQAILSALLPAEALGRFSFVPALLLTTIGARSGKERISPLAYLPVGERVMIIASKAGADSNPDWYYNVLANPEVTVEIGAEKFQARAEVLTSGPERDRLYALMAEQLPQFGEYQRKTTRTIPVILLDRLV